MLSYRVIEIFASEEMRWQGAPLHRAVVEYIKGLKIAARCQVFRAAEGCYESGEVATQHLEILSYNMPLYIMIVAPAFECERMLPDIEKMVTGGIVAVRNLDVVSHKTQRVLLHPHIRVQDIMTPSPQKAERSTPLCDVVRLLLSSIFTGIPVVDAHERPVGVITQGDLIYKGGMPVRLGLLAAFSNGDGMDGILASLASKKAEDVMSSPVVSIEADSPATEAVEVMLRKNVKRMPVVDVHGKLVGMLSRLDIFCTIMKESPDWESFGKQDIQVENLHFVSDIMRRDAHTVAPDTPVQDVMQIIDDNDIQRIAVVDPDGRFLGLISDSDILTAFSSGDPEGGWNYFISKLPFTERGRKYREVTQYLQNRTAADVMNTNVVTIREDALMEEAIQLMVKKSLKRLPVIDSAGKFKGMISRDSLLRTGFGQGVSGGDVCPLMGRP